jgi:hypothetical protein
VMPSREWSLARPTGPCFAPDEAHSVYKDDTSMTNVTQEYGIGKERGKMAHLCAIRVPLLIS